MRGVPQVWGNRKSSLSGEPRVPPQSQRPLEAAWTRGNAPRPAPPAPAKAPSDPATMTSEPTTLTVH